MSWQKLRRAVHADTRTSPLRLLVLDVLPILLAWGLLTCLTSRPLLAAVIVSAMTFGLARGDAAKRKASGEPLVFTDRVLGSIFFYPSLYAEFVTPGKLAVSIAAVLCGFAVLGTLEPALWRNGWPTALCVGLLLFAWGRRPRGAAFLTLIGGDGRTRCTFDPAADAAAMGPLAAAMVHATIAGVERAGRRSRHLPNRSPALPFEVPCEGPLVLLQLESFFDARRLGPIVPDGLLPEFDRCMAMATRRGRLEVPAYGANTVRTEFAALTGLSCAALGLDCFNPYADFARVPVDSIAWRLRAAGYRTICIHPFDGRFYGRRRVMPNLGFDSFLDIAAFPKIERSSPYVSDVEVVAKIAEVLECCGPRTLVFAITMGNHSPWRRSSRLPLDAYPQAAAFAGFLEGLRRTDEALGQIATTMQTRWPDGTLAAFGDHQPSFPRLYAHLGHSDRSTDYLVLRRGQSIAARQDIAAHALPGQLLRDMADWPAIVPARQLQVVPAP